MLKQSRIPANRAGSRGQVLVEMAVVMPFFLLVILGGIVDFGMAFHNFAILQQIADDTARYAAEENGPHGVISAGSISRYAQTRKPSWWTGTFIVHPPEIIPLETPAETGTPKAVRITISYCSPTYTPFYHTMFNAVSGFSSIRLQAAAAYKIPRVLLTR